MSIRDEDLKDRYVVGGRCHNPEDNSTVFCRNISGRFTVILKDEVKDDESAIREADKVNEVELLNAKTGDSLLMTLLFNGRVVKNYPKIIKQ